MTKEQSEREIFQELAKLAGLEVENHSIIQNRPPCPDIECFVQGSGPLSVELLCLDSPVTRNRIGNMHGSEMAWKHALEQRPSQEREKLATDCSNVFLQLQISGQDGSRQKIKLMTSIQDQLLALPQNFEGYLSDIRDRPDFGMRMPADRALRVTRGDDIKNGPRIGPISGSEWQMPQISKIEEKLRAKIYSAAAPLELFAYSLYDAPDAHVNSMAMLGQCVKKYLPTSLFQRVRIFNLQFKKLLFVYP